MAPKTPKSPSLISEQRREDVVVVDRVEPEAVGVDAGQRAQRHQQDDEDHDAGRAATSGHAGAGAARGQQLGRGGHARGEPNVRSPRPKRARARVDRRRIPAQPSAGATRQRQPECAGGKACPVGNTSVEASAPARALSSQSEQPPAEVTTQRTLPSAPCGRRGRHPSRERVRRASPASRSTRWPRHSRKAAPTRSPGLLAPVRDPPAQHGHDRPRQSRRGLVHRVALRRARPPRSRRTSPRRRTPRRAGSCTASAKSSQVRVLGPEEPLGVDARRAAQQVEHAVLVVTQRALHRPVQLRRDRREQLVTPADDLGIGTGRYRRLLAEQCLGSLGCLRRLPRRCRSTSFGRLGVERRRRSPRPPPCSVSDPARIRAKSSSTEGAVRRHDSRIGRRIAPRPPSHRWR